MFKIPSARVKLHTKGQFLLRGKSRFNYGGCCPDPTHTTAGHTFLSLVTFIHFDVNFVDVISNTLDSCSFTTTAFGKISENNGRGVVCKYSKV